MIKQLQKQVSISDTLNALQRDHYVFWITGDPTAIEIARETFSNRMRDSDWLNLVQLDPTIARTYAC